MYFQLSKFQLVSGWSSIVSHFSAQWFVLFSWQQVLAFPVSQESSPAGEKTHQEVALASGKICPQGHSMLSHGFYAGFWDPKKASISKSKPKGPTRISMPNALQKRPPSKMNFNLWVTSIWKKRYSLQDLESKYSWSGRKKPQSVWWKGLAVAWLDLT